MRKNGLAGVDSGHLPLPAHSLVCKGSVHIHGFILIRAPDCDIS